MERYTHSNIKKLFIVGDVHGEFKQLFHKIRTNVLKQTKNNEQEKLVDDDTLKKLEPFFDDMPHHVSSKFYNYSYGLGKHLGVIEDCVIIVAGDCGFGFNKEEYYHQLFNKYHEILELNNVFIYFVRGNHDDPSYFNEHKINYNNIKTVKDYSVITVNDKNILCVGGGLSIDRVWRKQQEVKINKYKKNIKKQLYWEDEMPVYSQEMLEEINNENIKIDVVVSHTSPHFVFPTKKDSLSYWAKLDKNLYKDSETERIILSNVYDFLIGNKHPLKKWCYGHFHCNKTNRKNDVEFIAINELDFAKIFCDGNHKENSDLVINPFFDVLIP